MILFSILLEVFHNYTPIIDDTLLATVYGGILLGVGCGLIIKEGGCLDGTEIVAILINRKKSLSVGQVVFCFNIVIYITVCYNYIKEYSIELVRPLLKKEVVFMTKREKALYAIISLLFILIFIILFK